VLSVVGTANGLPRVIATYPTETPFASYVGVLVASDIALGVFIFGIVLLAGGGAWLFTVLAFGEERTPSLRPPASYWRDAFVLGLTGTGMLLVLGRIGPVAGRLLPVERRSLPGTSPTDLDTFLPALGPITSAPFTAGLTALAIVIACAIGARYVRRRWVRLAVVVVLAIVPTGDATSLLEFARDYAVALAQVGLFVFWMTRVARFNALSLAIALVGLVLVRTGLDLVGQPSGTYLANGVVVLLVAALIYVFPLVLWRRGIARAGATEAVAPA
jgi:hypothetical protein